MLWIYQQLNQTIYRDFKYIFLSSGLVSCYEFQHNLLKAQKIGQLCLDTFITERIETNNIDFNVPIKKNCLHTFEKEKNSETECFKSKSSNMRRSRNLCKTFVDTTKMQSKFEINLDMYELGPLPLSISNYDWTLRKTQKSKLFQHLESSIDSCAAIRKDCPQIFDRMVLL